jgi:apolipoprotein N-acyltransferase
LVNVSNDAWFGDSFAPHQHLQMARMRAIETARPMLRATNNGVSAVIDHRGEVLATSPQFKVAVLDGEIQPQQGATPYVRVGNWPVLLALLLALGLCLLRRIRPG